jgi:hypothetical protein
LRISGLGTLVVLMIMILMNDVDVDVDVLIYGTSTLWAFLLAAAFL